ncbi:MAG: hypothetical protein M1840_001734 [Geoglossum simile]|nr:MAG: hypothetical protein M1840_001734 [Geoglossum simile]
MPSNLLPVSAPPPPQPSAPAQTVAFRWRDIGYRGASEWMSSEDDFFLVRRFATLNTRVLLAKQAEISGYERQLDELDDPAPDSDNSTFLEDPRPERKDLVKKLWRELKDYNEFIKVYSDLKSRPYATAHELRNVEGWMEDNEGAICPDESTFIAKTNIHDLMPVTPKTKSPLRRWISRQKIFPIARPFRKPPSPYLKHVDSEGSQYFSDQLIDATVYFITVMLAVSMLIAPLWWLNSVTNYNDRLVIITGCVVVFSVVVGAVTAARPFETVAATAGWSIPALYYLLKQNVLTNRRLWVRRYAAVLMVFMQVNRSHAS